MSGRDLVDEVRMSRAVHKLGHRATHPVCVAEHTERAARIVAREHARRRIVVEPRDHLRSSRGEIREWTANRARVETHAVMNSSSRCFMETTMARFPSSSRKASVRLIGVVHGYRAWSSGLVVARSLRLLLVEDHPDSAELLAELLESKGHTVRIAATASDALARAAEETFDLVVSDVGLPDGSGYELMQKLRDRSHSAASR